MLIQSKHIDGINDAFCTWTPFLVMKKIFNSQFTHLFSKQIHILLAPLKGHMVNVHVKRRMVEPASHIFVIVAQKVSV